MVYFVCSFVSVCLYVRVFALTQVIATMILAEAVGHQNVSVFHATTQVLTFISTTTKASVPIFT